MSQNERTVPKVAYRHLLLSSLLGLLSQSVDVMVTLRWPTHDSRPQIIKLTI